VAKLKIPVLPLQPELICRAGASATEVSFADVESGACAFQIVHWMGAKSPSPSFFCRGPLFRIHAALWSFVGRRTDRWIEPGYERLPEGVGYSLWRHHHERSSGPMSLRARLAWSWTDLKNLPPPASEPETAGPLHRPGPVACPADLRLARRAARSRGQLVPPESSG
jgi:hypothetical protein